MFERDIEEKMGLENMSKIVNVRRTPYTERDSERGRISGVINSYIETQTYVHVSSGRERVVITQLVEALPKLSEIIDAVAKGDRKQLEGLTQSIAIDYTGNVVYGAYVCIPGSTIKGLLRARLELCRSTQDEAFSCMHTKIKKMVAPPARGSHGWRHATIWGDVVLESRGDECNPSTTSDYSVCKVCDIFGAPGIVGRVMPSNFCGSIELEKLDLSYGEKLWAIPPKTKLNGSIAFTALSVDELGIVLISMGLVKDSTVGVDVLIGKHKYSHTNMGSAKFYITSIELPHRFKNTLESYKITYITRENKLIIGGEKLTELINMTIERALNKYPQLNNIYGFSEAQVKKNKGVAS